VIVAESNVNFRLNYRTTDISSFFSKIL